MKTSIYIFFIIFTYLGMSPAGLWAQENLEKTYPESSIDIPSELELLIEDTKESISKNILSSWFQEKTKLEINPDYKSEIENADFCMYKKSIPCRLSFSHQNEGHIQKKHVREISEENILKYLKDLAEKYNREPENAKLKMEDGRVATFSLSKDGKRLNEEEGLRIIQENLNLETPEKKLILVMEKIPPEVSIDSVENLGITSLIGQGRSNFKGSTANRIFNINVAIKKFNGLLIKPGEEFSFVKNLGEVDASTGYRPELVIKKDKTELDFGGGVCQVSTTAFRAAINSGLEVTARRNHAYPVSYYNPQGMDATVYVPAPDLKFKNNTPSHILIEVKIEETELIFNFYGTDDGRKINIIGPTVTERNPDGSMKTAFTQQVFDKDGKMVREDIFKSAYDSPNNYPHPDSTILDKKPSNWSTKEWKIYKKNHNLQ